MKDCNNTVNDNSTATSKTLMGCADSVEKECGGALSDADVRLMEECADATNKFRDAFIEEFNTKKMSPAQMCASAGGNSTIAAQKKMVEDKCKTANKLQEEQVKQKACNKAFKACRK